MEHVTSMRRHLLGSYCINRRYRLSMALINFSPSDFLWLFVEKTLQQHSELCKPNSWGRNTDCCYFIFVSTSIKVFFFLSLHVIFNNITWSLLFFFFSTFACSRRLCVSPLYVCWTKKKQNKIKKQQLPVPRYKKVSCQDKLKSQLVPTIQRLVLSYPVSRPSEP